MRKTSIYWATKACARLLLSRFKIKTSGFEHLPAQGGFVLLPKHQRWEDIPLLALASPRPLCYIAKYELFQNPLSGWLLSNLGGIPLNRSRPIESRKSLKRMVEYLEKGEGIVLFPEGAYYKNKMGPGRLALVRVILSRSSAPIIPVGISYCGRVGRTLVRINCGKHFDRGVSCIGADKGGDGIMGAIGELSGL